MKKLLSIYFFSCFAMLHAQYNYNIGGVNSWGIWGKPVSISKAGMPYQVQMDDPNPQRGSIRGTLDIAARGYVDDKGNAYFDAYMTSYTINYVFLEGKWRSVKQIMKCSKVKKFELRSVTFRVNHNISIKEKTLNTVERSYTISPPIGGAKPIIMKSVAKNGTILDVPMPHTVSIIAAKGLFNFPWELYNIKKSCLNNSMDITFANTYNTTRQEEPKPIEGVSLSESIKQKMSLFVEGNGCISITGLAGNPGCEDDAIQIRNSCNKPMTVQLALKSKSGRYKSETITIVKPRSLKKYQLGCSKANQSAKFVAIPANQKRRNLLCNPEWYLVSMIDLKGSPYVQVPYKAKPKKRQNAIPGPNHNISFKNKTKKNTGGGLGDLYFPDAYKKKKNTSNTTSGSSTSIPGFYGYTYKKGSRTFYVLYRFGNQNWQGGKWFRAFYVNYDPTRSGIKTRDFTYAGYWNQKGNIVEIKRWEAGRTQPAINPIKFKVEGGNLRLIQGLTGSGKPYNPNQLFTRYKTPPNSWPFVQTQKVKFYQKFAPN